ncbi:unnamed protein product [Blepharisma stoltei]|uniref:AN1-type domain-containing protein n=1 Tax=Blepharisma stoltei TaxID=1481888 RepID=A0AAU9JJW8_9CILI|nr:unnamed protein product [Blepharisma stoltei]
MLDTFFWKKLYQFIFVYLLLNLWIIIKNIKMESEMCRNCRVFYGCLGGLCSQCHKKEALKKEATDVVTTLAQVASAVVLPTEPAPQQPVQDRSRCFTCNKRVGPLSFTCKCQYSFCARHRLPEEHNCTFDHKSHGIRKLSEDNPLVVAEKFNKL